MNVSERQQHTHTKFAGEMHSTDGLMRDRLWENKHLLWPVLGNMLPASLHLVENYTHFKI